MIIQQSKNEKEIFESRLQRLCESNLNRAKKYANKSPVYFTVFRAFLYIVPCTGSCRRIRNSLSCRTICETICLSLFSNMGSQAYAVAARACGIMQRRAAARWLFYAAARCHHHHLVHLGEYFHGDHFWKILAFSRRNLRLFTFFRIPPAHVSCNEWQSQGKRNIIRFELMYILLCPFLGI